jgi:hypothetical protein
MLTSQGIEIVKKDVSFTNAVNTLKPIIERHRKE